MAIMTNHDAEMEMRYRRSWVGTLRRWIGLDWVPVLPFLLMAMMAWGWHSEVRELRRTIYRLEGERNWLRLENRAARLQSGEVLTVPAGIYWNPDPDFMGPKLPPITILMEHPSQNATIKGNTFR